MSETRVTSIATGAGILGAFVVAIASLATALAYTGAAGEPYSPLDHWVSELGEVGVSGLAPLFNAGLVVGGICFAVFMIGLAIVRSGPLRYVFGAVGAAAGVSGALVGIFPMNGLGPHALAAFAFFDLGWIAVGLASIDIAWHRDPRFPVWLSVLGVATVLAFLAFLASIASLDASTETLAAPDVRPEVWTPAALEWLTIAGILGWTLLASVAWRRAAQKAAAARDGAAAANGAAAGDGAAIGDGAGAGKGAAA